VYDQLKDRDDLLVGIASPYWVIASEELPPVPLTEPNKYGTRVITHNYDNWKDWPWGQPVEDRRLPVAGRILRSDEREFLMVSGTEYVRAAWEDAVLLEQGPDATVPPQLPLPDEGEAGEDDEPFGQGPPPPPEVPLPAPDDDRIWSRPGWERRSAAPYWNHPGATGVEWSGRFGLFFCRLQMPDYTTETPTYFYQLQDAQLFSEMYLRHHAPDPEFLKQLEELEALAYELSKGGVVTQHMEHRLAVITQGCLNLRQAMEQDLDMRSLALQPAELLDWVLEGGADAEHLAQVSKMLKGCPTLGALVQKRLEAKGP
jgi:hypothetical protein